MKIRSLIARPILDSRGQWTVEAALTLADGVRATASVPQGKSTGSSEARALPAEKAVRSVNNLIASKTRRTAFKNQYAFDLFLHDLDGTPMKSKLGANAMLASSIAFLKAWALTKKLPLWQHVRNVYGLPVRRSAHPRLFINMVNGGLHAGNNLDFQEYLVIPNCRTIKESVDAGVAVYRELGLMLRRVKGKSAANLGDEGGYAPNFKDNAEPFHLLRAAAKKLKLSKKIDFGMDAAATDVKKMKDRELETVYEKILKRYGLIYLEDPFGEEDFLSFAAFTMHFGKKMWIAGDDLTTTNVRRMERAHAETSVNAVIIKPNQIGTVTESLDAVRAARKYGWAVVCSHRSGETNDDFIADFAYGVGAEGLKLGAPARGERIAKYNRLLEIEKEARN
ncbi:MAG TPA: phosphopyruvate hydratase [Candidatus Paceibacterota bacterium]|nr:phosphopyruvate hydratase [Candidatus Paceibacterota bacterium]